MQRALGTLAIRIEHIGSTSVPGLAGKPIVDVLVTVADPDNEQRWCRQCSLPVTSYGFESRDIGCSEGLERHERIRRRQRTLDRSDPRERWALGAKAQLPH